MTTLTTLGGLNILRTGSVHFDVRVELIGGTLAPLSIGTEAAEAKATIQDGARFRIGIKKAQAGGNYTLDNVTIRVFIDDTRVHEEIHNTGPLARTGTNEWTWDGFSDKGEFSSWKPIDKKIQVMVIARHYPLATGDYGHIDIGAKRTDPKWIEVDIDRSKKIIDVWLRLGLAFVNGGARQFKDHLTKLFLSGVEKYWSREQPDGPMIDGERYAVKVQAEGLRQTDKNVLDFDIRRTNSSDYVRSHNSGIIDSQIYYNAGFFSSATTADRFFMLTAAHEFGHSVLEETGGRQFSWTHKGSTTLFQKTHDASPIYPTAPGEIDMMLYYADEDPHDLTSRSHASNNDILRLISLGKVVLG